MALRYGFMSHVEALNDGAQQVLDWIARQGLNQREAAGKLGIGKDYLNHIVCRRSKVGLRTALRIERTTGIPVEVWESTDVDIQEPTKSAKARKRLNR